MLYRTATELSILVRIDRLHPHGWRPSEPHPSHVADVSGFDFFRILGLTCGLLCPFKSSTCRNPTPEFSDSSAHLTSYPPSTLLCHPQTNRGTPAVRLGSFRFLCFDRVRPGYSCRRRFPPLLCRSGPVVYCWRSCRGGFRFFFLCSFFPFRVLGVMFPPACGILIFPFPKCHISVCISLWQADPSLPSASASGYRSAIRRLPGMCCAFSPSPFNSFSVYDFWVFAKELKMQEKRLYSYGLFKTRLDVLLGG